MKKQPQQKYNPELKNKALEMALDDFEQFCNFAGVNKTQLAVCIERQNQITTKKLSLQKIANKLNIPKTTVKRICDSCFPCHITEQK